MLEKVPICRYEYNFKLDQNELLDKSRNYGSIEDKLLL